MKSNFLKILPGILVLMAIFVSPEESPSQTQGLGRIRFEKNVIDFGIITEGEEVTKSFRFENTGEGILQLYETEADCGCTVARMSTTTFKPGDRGTIDLTVETRGDRGHLIRKVRVLSNDPFSPFLLTLEGIALPKTLSSSSTWVRNESLSCVGCHWRLSTGQMGGELYDQLCAICHDPPEDFHKEQAAPPGKSLRSISPRRLRKIISRGEEDEGMPAFLKSRGGPLTQEEINSIIEYIEEWGHEN